MITLTPAYGRDYKSKAKVLEAVEEGCDFIINDITNRWDGKPCNPAEDLKGEQVQFRFGKLRKVFVHQL